MIERQVKVYKKGAWFDDKVSMDEHFQFIKLPCCNVEVKRTTMVQWSYSFSGWLCSDCKLVFIPKTLFNSDQIDQRQDHVRCPYGHLISVGYCPPFSCGSCACGSPPHTEDEIILRISQILKTQWVNTESGYAATYFSPDKRITLYTPGVVIPYTLEEFLKVCESVKSKNGYMSSNDVPRGHYNDHPTHYLLLRSLEFFNPMTRK